MTMQHPAPINTTRTMRTNHENDADMTPREVREFEQKHHALVAHISNARGNVNVKYIVLQRLPKNPVAKRNYEESLRELKMARARLENFRAKTRLQPPMRKARCRTRPSAKHRRACTSVAVSFHFNKKN